MRLWSITVVCRRASSASEPEQADGDVVVAAPLVCQGDQSLGRDVEPIVRHDAHAEQVVADHLREAVRAEDVDVAVGGLVRSNVWLDLFARSERVRDERTLRMVLRLLRREGAQPEQLGHQRLVVGELIEYAVA